MRRIKLFAIALGGALVAWVGYQVATANPPIWAYLNWGDRFRASLGMNVTCREYVARDAQVACFGEGPTGPIRGLWIVPQDGTPCFVRDAVHLPARLTDEECAAIDDRAGENDDLWRAARAALINSADKTEWLAIDLELVGRVTRVPINEAPVGASLVPPYSRRYGVSIDRIASVRVRPNTVCPTTAFVEDGIEYAVNCKGEVVEGD